MNNIKSVIETTPSITLGGTKNLAALLSGKLKNNYLCNATSREPLNGTVELIWDDINSCPGLYFKEHESFLNIYDAGDNFASYYNSSDGFAVLVTMYNFLVDDPLPVADATILKLFEEAPMEERLIAAKGWLKTQPGFGISNVTDISREIYPNTIVSYSTCVS